MHTITANRLLLQTTFNDNYVISLCHKGILQEVTELIPQLIQNGSSSSLMDVHVQSYIVRVLAEE